MQTNSELVSEQRSCKYSQMITLVLWVLIILGGVFVSSISCALTARVSKTRSGPVLLVNEVPKAPLILFTNLDIPSGYDISMEEITTAGKYGVDLVSINFPVELTPADKEPDYSRSDGLIKRALAANPKALLLLRIQIHYTPEWWASIHPDDMMLYKDGKGTNASVTSHIWRRDVTEQIEKLVGHFENEFGNYIFGYHPCGQETGEWFYARMWDSLAGFEVAAKNSFREFVRGKYKNIQRLRKAWGDASVTFETVDVPTLEDRTTVRTGFFLYPAKDQHTIDFFEFQNFEMADTVSDMCKAVKTAAPKKITVAFYGYHFTVIGQYGLQSSGHLGLERLLKSPYVDAICSPIDYFDRKSGGAGYMMAPVDSVTLHGKLWITEDDVRTYLASQVHKDFRLADERETNGVLTRDFSQILTRGAGLWWMDLGAEGWFSGEGIWKYLKTHADTYSERMPKFKQYSPQIAVIVDEKSIFYTSPSSAWQAPLIYSFRYQYYRIGAPVGFYLLSDLVNGRVPAARMYIFIDAFCLDKKQIAAIRKYVCCKDKTALWMYAPGIVKDGTIDQKNVEEITGIRLKKVAATVGDMVVDANGKTFEAGHMGIDPQFAIDDKSTAKLFGYSKIGDNAVGVRKFDDWSSVYSGVLKLPSGLLRDIARQAGVHIYVDSDDVVSAGNGYACISATDDGVKTFYPPNGCGVTDVLTGRQYPKSSSLSFDMKKGDSKLLKLSD